MTELELESLLNQIKYCETQLKVIDKSIKHCIEVRDTSNNPEIKRTYRRYSKKLEKLKHLYIDSLYEFKLLYHHTL